MPHALSTDFLGSLPAYGGNTSASTRVVASESTRPTPVHVVNDELNFAGLEDLAKNPFTLLLAVGVGFAAYKLFIAKGR